MICPLSPRERVGVRDVAPDPNLNVTPTLTPAPVPLAGEGF